MARGMCTAGVSGLGDGVEVAPGVADVAPGFAADLAADLVAEVVVVEGGAGGVRVGHGVGGAVGEGGRGLVGHAGPPEWPLIIVGASGEAAWELGSDRGNPVDLRGFLRSRWRVRNPLKSDLRFGVMVGGHRLARVARTRAWTRPRARPTNSTPREQEPNHFPYHYHVGFRMGIAYPSEWSSGGYPLERVSHGFAIPFRTTTCCGR